MTIDRTNATVIHPDGKRTRAFVTPSFDGYPWCHFDESKSKCQKIKSWRIEYDDGGVAPAEISS
jgi:hypothetical protein